MAGASVAAHLAEFANVRLLEMEHQLGLHSTGRSAALFSETYGNHAIRALTSASRRFLFAAGGFLLGSLGEVKTRVGGCKKRPARELAGVLRLRGERTARLEVRRRSGRAMPGIAKGRSHRCGTR